MPAFGELLGQDAAWAIRTYIETRPDDDSMADVAVELKGIRDVLAAGGGDLDALKVRLTSIAENIETVSGAPVADSAASRAAALLDGTDLGVSRATEALTIGLSAAH
jgi:hypothetical protein